MKMLTEGKEFISKIKEARLAAGLTQKQVSDLTGVPFRSIQNWEAGVRKCPDYVVNMVVTMINKTGHWRKYSSDEWICSKCGYSKYCDTLDGGVLPPYCEECGVKMNM